MSVKNLVPWTLGKRGLTVRKEHNPFTVLQREMDDLFENFTRGFFEMEPFEGRARGFAPDIDLTEGEKELVVTAELPGMDEKDIDISVNKETLTVKGEKKEEKEEKTKTFYRMERSYGSFSRTIPLPAEVDVDKIEAVFKKGVLKITIPKTQKALEETKKIAVKAA